MSLRPSRRAAGHEQKGTRPAVVVQSDGAWWLRTVLVVPTSTRAQPAEFRPEITVRGRVTRALLDQMTSVDRERIGRSSGHIAAAELYEVDEALKLLLGLL